MQEDSTNALQAWWNGLDDEARIDWYRRNKRNPNNKRKQFNDQLYIEAERKLAPASEDALYDFIPLEEWQVREGSKGKTTEESTESFWAAVTEPGRRIKTFGAMWLVGVFKGVREAAGSAQEHVQELAARRHLDDSQDHEALRALREEATRAHAAWLLPTQDNIVVAERQETPEDFDERMLRPALDRSAPEGQLLANTQRNTYCEEHSNIVGMDLEERYVHEAQEAARLNNISQTA